MSHQQRVIKLDNSYGKTALCATPQELESHAGRRVPASIINSVVEQCATVHWQGMKFQLILDPPNHISDVAKVKLEATRQLLQE